MKRFFKRVGWLVGTLTTLVSFILILLVFFVIFINPISHWAIEKYAPDFLGRKVLIKSVKVRPFSGRITVDGLRLFEQNGQDVFAYAGQTQLRLNIGKMIGGTYHIDSIATDTLIANVLQDGYAFNFDDFLATLLAEDTTTTTDPSDTLKYYVGKTQLNHVVLTYQNKQPAVRLMLDEGTLLIPVIAWNKDVIRIETEARVNKAGRIEAVMDYNMATADYQLTLKAAEVSTAPLFPYFADFLTSTRADGIFSSQMQLRGNADTPTQIAMKGKLQLRDFVLTDAYDEKQLGWENFSVEIDTVNTATNVYRFDNVVLNQPYLLFTLTNEGDNLSALMKVPDTSSASYQTLAGTEGTAAGVINPFIMLADVIGDIAEQYSKNEYGMNRFAIENGTVVYNDFLTNEKFSVLFEQFNAQTASFNDASKVVKFDISTLMNRYGDVKALLAVDNTNYKDFDLNLNINSLTMSIFNPYTKYYVAHPFWRGDISFNTRTTVKSGELDSRNRLIIKQVKVGDKVKSDSAFNIPVKLAVAILRDRKGNIDLEIPIKGSLSDPDYKWGKAALKVLKNLLVKAVTAPYDLLAKAIGGNPEDLKAVVFNPLQDSLEAPQRKSLEAMTKVLTEKPEMTLKLLFRMNTMLERDEMAVRKALEQFTESQHKSSDVNAAAGLPTDSLHIYSASDSLFTKWVTQKTRLNSPSISLQDKCIAALGGESAVDQLVEAINQRRDSTISAFFIQAGIMPDRFNLARNTDDHLNMNTPLPTYDATFDAK